MMDIQQFTATTFVKGVANVEDWRTICILNKNHETMEGPGGTVPVWLVAGKEKDGTHHLLRIHGEGIYPSFGVPYEEFWKVIDDPRVKGYRRGPDSPFGEPVMEVITSLPKDIGSGEDKMRDFVSHSYQGDVNFENKAANDKGIWEGYMMFDAFKVKDFGYIEDKYIKPPAPGFEKFYVPKMKLYMDSEWNMEGLMDEKGRLSFRRKRGEKDDKEKYDKSRVITISFLESIGWAFHVFTWHPRIKERCTFREKYITRIGEAARKKIPQMPGEYEVIVHACETEQQLLKEMVDYLANLQYDAIVPFNGFSGWHGLGNDRKWINGFDFPWLYRRMMIKKDQWHWVPRFKDADINRISPVGTVYIREDFGKDDVVIKMATRLDLWHMMSFFEYHKKYKLKNEKLDTFMETFLGVGKHKRKHRYVWEDWKDDPKDERLYNQADTEGTAAVEQLFQPTEDCFNRSSFAGANWEDGMSASRMHDMVNLHLYRGLHYLDTKGYDKKYERTWLSTGFMDEKVGGFNKEPKPGMHKKSFGMDFNKFYPMMGIGTNCAPETFINVDHLEFTPTEGLVVVDKRQCLKKEVNDWPAFIKECRVKHAQDVEDGLIFSLQDTFSQELVGWEYTRYRWNDLIITPSGMFRKDIIARNVLAFQSMLKERKGLQKIAETIFKQFQSLEQFEYKVADQRQFSFKGFMNGRFGVQGMEDDRIYMLALFNSYTAACQHVIIECVRYVEEELGYPVNLASTDSMICNLKRDIKWIEKIIKGEKFYYCEEAEEVVELVQKHAQEFAKREFNIPDASVFTLECDFICKTMFIENMRFYIKNVMWKGGKILDPPQLEFKGMKRVRREVAWITEYVQESVGKIVMNEGKLPEIEKCVLGIHERFNKLDLTQICKVMPVNMPYEEYSETSEQFKAFSMADKYLGMDVMVGDRFFIAPVKYCPPVINGMKVDPRLGDVVAFDYDNVDNVEKAGLIIDRHEIEDKAVADAADELLDLFGTGYWKVIDRSKIADTFGEF